MQRWKHAWMRTKGILNRLLAAIMAVLLMIPALGAAPVGANAESVPVGGWKNLGFTFDTTTLNNYFSPLAVSGGEPYFCYTSTYSNGSSNNGKMTFTFAKKRANPGNMASWNSLQLAGPITAISGKCVVEGDFVYYAVLDYSSMAAQRIQVSKMNLNTRQKTDLGPTFSQVYLNNEFQIGVQNGKVHFAYHEQNNTQYFTYNDTLKKWEGGLLASADASMSLISLGFYEGKPYLLFGIINSQSYVLKMLEAGVWVDKSLPESKYSMKVDVFDGKLYATTSMPGVNGTAYALHQYDGDHWTQLTDPIESPNTVSFYVSAGKIYMNRMVPTGIGSIKSPDVAVYQEGVPVTLGKPYWGYQGGNLSQYIAVDQDNVYWFHFSGVGVPGVNVYDTIPPEVVTYTPVPAAVGVKVKDNLGLTFSEKVVPVANKKIEIIQHPGGTVVQTISTSGLSPFASAAVSVKLTKDLDYDTSYEVHIEQGAFADEAGLPYAGLADGTWHFTTEQDQSPLTVKTYAPAPAAVKVPVDSTLALTFNKKVTAAAGKSLKITRSDGRLAASIRVDDASQVTIADKTVTIRPAEPLEYDKSYYVTVDADAFADSMGMKFAGISNTSAWTFSTENAISASLSSLAASPSIVTANGEDASTIQVTVKNTAGQAVSGKQVQLAAGSGRSTIVPLNAVTDSNGIARFQVTDETAEEVLYTAKVGQNQVGQSVKVAFVAGATDASQSTVSASPASVRADGTAASRITVTLKDAKGNPVGGKTVILTPDGGSSVMQGSGLTNAAGQAVFTVTNQTAERVVYTAKTGGTTLTQQAEVSFEASDADPARSMIKATPSSVTADGLTASRITVTLKDAKGNVLKGAAVTLTAESGSSVITGTGLTDDTGQAIFQVTNNTPESVSYTAAVGPVKLTGKANVEFTKIPTGPISASQSSLTVAPSTVTADGVEKAVFTITLRNAAGQPVRGHEVSLSASGGSSVITPMRSVSDADGQAVFTAVNAQAEQLLYTATDKTDGIKIAQQAVATFESMSGAPATSVTASTVTALPAKVKADGSETSTVKVTLRDEQGRAIGGHTVHLTANGGSSRITDMQKETDADGIALFGVTNTAAEQVTYSAADQTGGVTLAQQAAVTFESTRPGGGGIPAEGVTDVLQSTVTSNPPVVKADGTEASTVTITLKDKAGQPVSGKTVSLTADSGSSTVTAVQSVSNGVGEAVFRVTNRTAEQISYTAKDTSDGVTLAAKAVVTFESVGAPGGEPGGPVTSVTNAVVTAAPAVVKADGSESSTVTVTLRDAQARAVVGHTVVLTARDGSSRIDDIQRVSDADGRAVFRVTNTSAEQVTYTAEDTTGHVTLAQTVAVTFESAAPGGGNPDVGRSSVLNSKVNGSPSTVKADGTEYSTVTVTLKDTAGQPVTGKTVRLTADGGSSVITAVYETSDSQGQAIFRVTNSRAEQVIYTAKDLTDDVTLAQTAKVTFESDSQGGNPGPGNHPTSVLLSTILAAPPMVKADGTDASTIIVTLNDTDGNPVSGKTVRLTANRGSSVIRSLQAVSGMSGQAVFQVTDTSAGQVTYTAEDTTSQVTLAQKAVVTFQTSSTGNGTPTEQVGSVLKSTLTASPVSVKANGVEHSVITAVLNDVYGAPVSGKTITLTANRGSSSITAVRSVTDAQGIALFHVTNTAGEPIIYSALDVTDQVHIAQKATVTFNRLTQSTSSVVRSTVVAAPAAVKADGVEMATVTVTLLDMNGLPVQGHTVKLTAEGVNSVITEVQDISDANGQAVFKVTGAVAGQALYSAYDLTSRVNVAQRAKVIFESEERTAPLKPEDITTDPTRGEVTVKDVPPGTKVTVYDDQGEVIGEGTNPGPGEGPVIIGIPGLKEGDVIKVTVTDPGKKESEPTSKTVGGEEERTPSLKPEDITTDPTRGEVTVKDLPPGTKVTVYDDQGEVIGEGTNPGPGKGPVIIRIPGLKEGDVIKLTATDQGKKESEPTSKTVGEEERTEQLKPENITTDPARGEVTVKDVPPGTKVTVYDDQGEVIGEGTNPGPGKGPVIIHIPGLKEGDVIKVTVTEPGKKESEPTSKTVGDPDNPGKKIYDVETEWEKDTVSVTVKLKPGEETAYEHAYVVFQGMREDTPVFTTGYAIDGKRPVPFKLRLEAARPGDQVWIVVVSEPEYARSQIGYPLSEETIQVVGNK
ncbi:Ig-like domain-containing protein [Paenibacillus filicis]|uniref:Ig-like domain-containing protein n=1 Tax=Paenibacillus filicis TaxID=669464 RepID=A0ABU9DR01_9BACL